MTTILPGPICLSCKWLDWYSGTEGVSIITGSPIPLNTCAAFPEGIPEEIGKGADHRQPIGNETIVWEMSDHHMASSYFQYWEAEHGAATQQADDK